MNLMSPTTTTGLHKITPSQVPTIEIHTLRDEELDQRTEQFFEAVEKLIFSDRLGETRKVAILRRYARILRNRSERKLADNAWQLAETYEATLRQFR